MMPVPTFLGAGACARLGEAAGAKEWAERAMSLPPDDDAILYNAGCALAVVGVAGSRLGAAAQSSAFSSVGAATLPNLADPRPAVV
jgi:hypothetical protein